MIQREEISVTETIRMLSKDHHGFQDRLVVRPSNPSPGWFGYSSSIYLMGWNEQYGYWDIKSGELLKTHTSWSRDKMNRKGEKGSFRVVFYRDEVEKLIAQYKNRHIIVYVNGNFRKL